MGKIKQPKMSNCSDGYKDFNPGHLVRLYEATISDVHDYLHFRIGSYLYGSEPVPDFPCAVKSLKVAECMFDAINYNFEERISKPTESTTEEECGILNINKLSTLESYLDFTERHIREEGVSFLEKFRYSYYLFNIREEVGQYAEDFALEMKNFAQTKLDSLEK